MVQVELTACLQRYPRTLPSHCYPQYLPIHISTPTFTSSSSILLVIHHSSLETKKSRKSRKLRKYRPSIKQENRRMKQRKEEKENYPLIHLDSHPVLLSSHLIHLIHLSTFTSPVVSHPPCLSMSIKFTQPTLLATYSSVHSSICLSIRSHMHSPHPSSPPVIIHICTHSPG